MRMRIIAVAQVLFFLVIVCVAPYVVLNFKALDEFTDIRSEGEAAIRSLYQRRPKDISRDRWNLLVDSLVSAYANVCFSTEQIDNKKHRILVGRMQRIAKDDVDVSTINRLWDLFENVSPEARAYVSRHKLMLDDFPDSKAE